MKGKVSDFKFDPKLLDGCEFHDNISQVYIRTTEDKLRNILRDFKDSYATKYAWTAPLGIFISLLATLQTATFTDKFGFNKEFWQALFYFFTTGSLIWLVISGIRALFRIKETNTQFTIDRIKNSIQ